MALIWTDYDWSPIDLASLCRNWRTTPEGTSVRMANRAAALVALSKATNHLLARHPATLFHMPQPITALDACQAYTSTLDPLYRWLRPDYWDNGRTYRARFLAVPRLSATTDCYAFRSGGALTEQTAIHNTVVAAQEMPDDCFFGTYPVVRGAATDDEDDDSIAVSDGYQLLDTQIQDDLIEYLDTSSHLYTDSKLAKIGMPVLADLMEQVRSNLHAARRYNMGMAFCWAAQGTEGTPASTAATGIVVTSTTDVNVIDQTVTARTATSPGIMVPGYLKGRGTLAKAAGQTVRVDVRVLGLATGASNGAVTFEGPNGAVTVTVAAGGGLAWYGGGATPAHIDLSTNSADATDVDASRNKIDILAKIASGTLYIYGLSGWFTYE